MSLTDAEKNRIKKAGLTGLNKPKKRLAIKPRKRLWQFVIKAKSS